MKTLLFSMLIVLLSLAGCRSTRPAKQTKQVFKDSTWVETTYHKRDTVIVVPGDTTRISIPVTKLTEKPITKTNGHTTAIVRRDGNNIDVQCLTAELRKQLDWLEKEIKKNSVKEHTTEIKTEVPVKYVPFFTKLLAWIGRIALFGGVGFVGFKLFLKR